MEGSKVFEKVLLKELYDIDNKLESILINMLDNDAKYESKEIGYILTSISVLANRLKKENKTK